MRRVDDNGPPWHRHGQETEISDVKTDDLKTILCRLEPGMFLTVTDEWAAKTIPGTYASRALELR